MAESDFELNMRAKKRFHIYQIHTHLQQTSRDSLIRRTQCAHHVRQRHKMEIVPSNRLAVIREHHSISSVAGNYHPILRILCTAFSILIARNEHNQREKNQKNNR